MPPRKSRHGSVLKGRIWLVVIFLFLRGTDLFLYFAIHSPHKERILGACINDTIWDIALLTAIWCRRNWARYVMVIRLLASVALAFLLEAGLADYIPANFEFAMVIYSFALLLPALVLIWSPSIHRLTSSSYD